jgi:uncharacterized protein
MRAGESALFMVNKRKKIIAKYLFLCIQSIKSVFQIQRGCCRFSPTCSEYAKEAVEKLPVKKAVSAILKRILRCHPFNAGGYDPVHESHITTKG